MKLITFAVPCYNSAEYMEKCIHSLLPGGDQVEIILVDDGSTRDDTPAICDRYAAEYPGLIRTVHQENGGHGAGVNRGLQMASGLYFKVVDSDDWLEENALRRLLSRLKSLVETDSAPDLLIANYVYEHTADNTSHRITYRNVFPQETLFGWEDCGRFRMGQYLLMHSVIYRTELLRDCGLDLPRHTFYVDNLFVYQPLPYVKTMYYMDLDLYRYFIGRSDQSVNERIMVSRVDQQLLVTRLMFACHNLTTVKATQPRLARYMFRYLSMMVAICDSLLNLDGSREALDKKRLLWQELSAQHPELRARLRHFSLAGVSNLPGRAGRRAELTIYRTANRIFKFN